MFEIIPNWHPFFVHFTIGLLITSTLAFLALPLLKDEAKKAGLKISALWMLWLGSVFTLATVAMGFYAFGSVGHDDPSHLVMKTHRNFALPTAAFFVLLAGWSYSLKRKSKALPGYFPVLMVAGAIFLGVTGWYGGELVYRHGLGVMTLPETEGEGHDHGEAEGESHSHDEAANSAEEEEEEGEGHSHDEALSDAAGSMAVDLDFDLSTPEGVVDSFFAALQAGDADAVRAVTSPNVMIFESGGIERSLDEYAGHHMPSDMAFVSGMEREILERKVEVFGDAATVITQGRTFGTFRDKDYNIRGTETMVLRRDGEGWKIVHIHWSSREIQG